MRNAVVGKGEFFIEMFLVREHQIESPCHVFVVEEAHGIDMLIVFVEY